MWILHKEAFELRYKDQYIYWDRTGEMTMRLLAGCPGIQVAKADPGQVIMQSPSEALTIRFNYEILSVIHEVEDGPKTPFGERASSAAEIVLKLAEVKTLTRIGYRQTYHRYFSRLVEAKDYLQICHKNLSFGGGLLDGWTDSRIDKKQLADFHVRLEDANTGVRIELVSGERAVAKEKSYLVAVDVDFYTRNPVTIDTLDVDEFLKLNKPWTAAQLLPRLPS
jgi:hypothetical protein